MTSWPTTLINILLGSTSAAYLGEMEWEKLFEYGESFGKMGGFRELEEIPEMRGLQRGEGPLFLYGRPSSWQRGGQGEKGFVSPGAGERSATLGRNREGQRWGNLQRNTQAKTKLGGRESPHRQNYDTVRIPGEPKAVTCLLGAK